eukprot:6492149-Amphidinium_carterae.1
MLWNQWPGQPAPPRETSDPPQWPGWGHYREWKRSVRRWDAASDILVDRRGARLMRTFDWSLQERLSHVPEQVLRSPQYLDEIIRVLDVFAGEHQENDLRRSLHAALMSWQREKSETLTQYTMRREMQCREAAGHGVVLPEPVQGYLLLQGAGLSAQSQSNLRTLTAGQILGSEVARALRMMDTTSTTMEGANASKAFLADAAAAEESPDETGSWSSSLEAAVFAELTDLDLDEAEATQAWSMIESAREQSKGKKRSWVENRRFKSAIKKDRSGILGMIRQQRQAGGGSASHSAPSATGTSLTSADKTPAVRKKLSIAELKLVSRCANCGQKGHWKAECTNAYRPKQVHMAEEGHTAFVYGPNSGSSGSEHPGSGLVWWSNMAEQTPQSRAQEWLARKCPRLTGRGRTECMAPHIFLTLPAGTAIVDSAAGQDLIGKPTYDRLCEIWAHHNIKPLRLEKRPQAAAGVGGKAHPLFQALIPLAFPGADIGFVEVTVVDADLPHLLSVGLLTHLGAIINLAENTLELRAMNKVLPMTRTPGGHCYVEVANWSGSEPIVMSARAAQGYGVSPDALQMKAVHHAASESESRTNQVRVKAASAVQRAYCVWRSSSFAAVPAQTRQRHHVGQRRKENSDSSHSMEASRARRSVARTYLLLAAASIGLHWQTDSFGGKSECHREPLCPSPPEEGCKPAWHLD